MRKRLFVAVFASACIFVGGCRSGVAVVNPCDVRIGSHSAVAPVARLDKEWWTSRHQGVLNRIQEGNVNLIFIGDSITHGWENKGKELWRQHYEPLGAVNMGFSGDRTQHVLWRLEHGEIDGISPKLAVIMIGTNNSNGTDNTSEEIADGIQAIVCKLRTDLPETQVLILAIFPRGSRDQRKDKTQDATFNPQWEKNAQASELASKMADGKMITYLDINKAFLDENGTLTRKTMPDLLHPNTNGYQLWAEAMNPTIQKLLSE